MNQLQQGSTNERSAWMAKIRRMMRACSSMKCGPLSDFHIPAQALADLLEWGKAREKRTNAKKGGL